MHQGRAASRLTRTPTAAASRPSLDPVSYGESATALPRRVPPRYQEQRHEDLVDTRHEPEAGRHSRASSTTSSSAAAVATATPPLPMAEGVGSAGGPIGSLGGARRTPVVSKEIILVVWILVALCLLLLALVYLNLSAAHRPRPY
ncbi:hypothetical protein V5799_010958 [Amblyomma americanum]|uniref:Uncharacterized protein n=1 Tax=Amblyomma americanum TaxID=6943 RepID=A0AAQ4EIB0_AMBAM